MDKKEAGKNKVITAIKILAVLAVVSFILAALIGIFVGDFEAGNVALIKVDGVITTTEAGFFGGGYAVSDDIIKLIKKAEENPSIKAIIIEVNSPGGSAVASDEIGNAIKKTNKTTVSVIREVGASGGYWVASSADHAIANRMSVTGSIGAIMSYLEFSGLLNRYNITYERLVAGKYKDVGSPFRDLAPEERAILQVYLDEIHNEFIKTVAENRNLSQDEVRKIATGMFFTGSRAKELGLVDELGGMDEAKAYIEKRLNITAEIVEYEKSVTLADILSEIISKQSFSVGEGVGSALFSREGEGLKV